MNIWSLGIEMDDCNAIGLNKCLPTVSSEKNINLKVKMIKFCFCVYLL